MSFIRTPISKLITGDKFKAFPIILNDRIGMYNRVFHARRLGMTTRYPIDLEDFGIWIRHPTRGLTQHQYESYYHLGPDMQPFDDEEYDTDGSLLGVKNGVLMKLITNHKRKLILGMDLNDTMFDIFFKYVNEHDGKHKNYEVVKVKTEHQPFGKINVFTCIESGDNDLAKIDLYDGLHCSNRFPHYVPNELIHENDKTTFNVYTKNIRHVDVITS